MILPAEREYRWVGGQVGRSVGRWVGGQVGRQEVAYQNCKMV